jgi:hypothetical protein
MAFDILGILSEISIVFGGLVVRIYGQRVHTTGGSVTTPASDKYINDAIDHSCTVRVTTLLRQYL